MRKWPFWTAMCLVSILNGAFFFGASVNSMRQGLSGVDNQAALLFIPLLWIVAGLALIALNVYTLIQGMTVEKRQIVCISVVFNLSGLSKGAMADRISFFVMTCLLMLFGHGLFASATVLSTAYALSGGILLLFLYAWRMAGLQGAAQRHAT